MSKAEKRAFEAYPVMVDETVGGTRLGGLTLPYDTNEQSRKKFQEGYEQAEKDLELTWEDVDWLLEQVRTMSGLWVKTNPSCDKVLQKFNEMKGSSCDSNKKNVY